MIGKSTFSAGSEDVCVSGVAIRIDLAAKIQKLYFAPPPSDYLLLMSDPDTRRKTIFIGGSPRSGTTMLGAILGSHSAMVTTPETQFKFDFITLSQSGQYNRPAIEQLMANHRRWKVWGFQVDWDQLNYSSPLATIHSLVDQYARSIGKVNTTIWIDHTPVNVRHAHALSTYYPEARFIHLIRDGRAVMASQMQLDWGFNDPVFAALKWQEIISAGLACESYLQEKCLRVHYEDVVREPEKTCRQICDFIGVPFEYEMLSGTGFHVPAYTRKQHRLVGQMPNPERIEQWKSFLKPKDIALFESLTYDVLPMLGYEKMNPGIQPKPSELKQIRVLGLGAIKYMTVDKLKNKLRLWKHTRKKA